MTTKLRGLIASATTAWAIMTSVNRHHGVLNL